MSSQRIFSCYGKATTLVCLRTAERIRSDTFTAFIELLLLCWDYDAAVGQDEGI